MVPNFYRIVGERNPMDANTPPPISTPIPPASPTPPGGYPPLQFQQAENTQANGTDNGDKLANASKIIGIISLIFFPVSAVLASIGLVLGIIGKNKGTQKTSGIVMNAIALGLSIVCAFIAISLVKSTVNMVNNFVEDINNGQYMECYTEEGDKIDIYYDETDITGYFAFGDIDFDLDHAQSQASRLGVEKYLDRYATQFEKDYINGVCEK